jgi:hypothetical protein
MTNRPMFLCSSIEFLLTYSSAKAIWAQQNPAAAAGFAAGLEESGRPDPDSEAAPRRFRVVVHGDMGRLSVQEEAPNMLGEVCWNLVNCVAFGGAEFDADCIICVAFQRLMQMVREQVSHTVVNDGQAIKYDLGVL